jgi:competence protein ComGC
MENARLSRIHPSLRSYIVVLFMHKTMANLNQKVEQAFKERQQKTRQLMMDLAARAYELDRGKKPTSTTDLVPAYLKAIPQDPFTGTNLVYSP